jgi:hypothetical protein
MRMRLLQVEVEVEGESVKGLDNIKRGSWKPQMGCVWRCKLCIGSTAPLGAWAISRDPVAAFNKHLTEWHDRPTRRTINKVDFQDPGPTMEQQYEAAIATATKLSIFTGTR